MKQERLSLPSERPSTASHAVMLRRHWRLLGLLLLPSVAGFIWRVAALGNWEPAIPCLLSLLSGYGCWHDYVARTIRCNTGTYHRYKQPVGYWINVSLFFAMYLAFTAAIFFARF